MQCAERMTFAVAVGSVLKIVVSAMLTQTVMTGQMKTPAHAVSSSCVHHASSCTLWTISSTTSCLRAALNQLQANQADGTHNYQIKASTGSVMDNWNIKKAPHK